MTKALYSRTVTGFAPADDDAQRYWDRFKVGDTVLLDFSLPRSIQQHKYYWRLVEIVLENTDGVFDSKEEASDSIKLACGLSNTVHIKFKGEWYERKTPASISFGSLAQEEFNPFFDKAMAYVYTELIPGLDPVTLEQEVRAA